MLVLSRRVGEKLCIGGDVWITVVSVKGSQVRLGIEAPADVAIRREEICFEVSDAPVGKTPEHSVR